MMNKEEENTVQIADYLEGKMSLAEEAGFMLKLSNDAALRDQYEDEIFISGLLSKKDEDAILLNIFSQADEENRAEIIAPATREKRGVFIWLHSYKNIAAVVLLLLAATVTYLFLKTANKQPAHIIAAAKDTISPVANSRLLPNNSKQIADSIFNNFYATYTAGEADPVEVSEYYEAYKKGHFAKVISATKTDYQTMSAGNENSAAELYMDFYKGLAFLGINKPDSAIEKLNIVIQANSKISDLYYAAQWYAALAWLKKNNVTQVVTIAKNIQQSASPYKLKAGKLVKVLSK